MPGNLHGQQKLFQYHVKTSGLGHVPISTIHFRHHQYLRLTRTKRYQERMRVSICNAQLLITLCVEFLCTFRVFLILKTCALQRSVFYLLHTLMLHIHNMTSYRNIFLMLIRHNMSSYRAIEDFYFLSPTLVVHN